jgi:hypothetical protein
VESEALRPVLDQRNGFLGLELTTPVLKAGTLFQGLPFSILVVVAADAMFSMNAWKPGSSPPTSPPLVNIPEEKQTHFFW